MESTLMVSNPHGISPDGNPHEPNPHGLKPSWDQPLWFQTLMESTLMVPNPHGDPHGNTHEPNPHGLKPSWKNNPHGSKPSWNQPSCFQTLMESTLMETLMNRTLMDWNPHGINPHVFKPSWNQPWWFDTLMESALMDTLMKRTLMDWNPHGKTTLMFPNPHGINPHAFKLSWINPYGNPHGSKPSWIETLMEKHPSCFQTLMESTLMVWYPHGISPHGNPYEPNPHGLKPSWNQPSWLQTLMESTLMVQNPHGNPHGNTHEPYPHGLKPSWNNNPHGSKPSWNQPSCFQTLMNQPLWKPSWFQTLMDWNPHGKTTLIFSNPQGINPHLPFFHISIQCYRVLSNPWLCHPESFRDRINVPCLWSAEGAKWKVLASFGPITIRTHVCGLDAACNLTYERRRESLVGVHTLRRNIVWCAADGCGCDVSGWHVNHSHPSKSNKTHSSSEPHGRILNKKLNKCTRPILTGMGSQSK